MRRRARRDTPLDAYRKAFATDPTSAFGGIIAFNRAIDGETVEAVCEQFVEVLIAPAFTPDALAAIARKANVRVLEIALADADARRQRAGDLKRVGGGAARADAVDDAPTVRRATRRLQES